MNVCAGSATADNVIYRTVDPHPTGGIGSVLYSDRTMAPDDDAAPWEGFLYTTVGHTTVVTNSAGSPTQASVYEAFGQTVYQTGTSRNNRLANTKERDAAIGLDNHGFRYYDPAIGRYLTRDPIGYGDGALKVTRTAM